MVPAPLAPAGSSDVTRRWGLRFADGVVRFAGVTRPEGDAAAAELAAASPESADAALVEIVLPVVLAEGAGPYLLDAEGRITLVLAAHPRIAGASVAMGEPRPAHRVGLVRRRAGTGLWEWLVDAEVDAARRVAALDGLDALTDPADGPAWRALQ